MGQDYSKDKTIACPPNRYAIKVLRVSAGADRGAKAMGGFSETSLPDQAAAVTRLMTRRMRHAGFVKVAVDVCTCSYTSSSLAEKIFAHWRGFMQDNVPPLYDLNLRVLRPWLGNHLDGCQ